MKTKVALKYQPVEEALAPKASVRSLFEHKKKRIEKILNSNVQIAGCGNVKVKQLFCPQNKALLLAKSAVFSKRLAKMMERA